MSDVSIHDLAYFKQRAINDAKRIEELELVLAELAIFLGHEKDHPALIGLALKVNKALLGDTPKKPVLKPLDNKGLTEMGLKPTLGEQLDALLKGDKP